MTTHKYITWEIIKDNPNEFWDWYWLSSKPNIIPSVIKDNPDKNWNWKGLSQNPNITWDIIRDTSNEPWNWGYLSKNPNITWDIIEANPDKYWSWRGISWNPNITWEIIRDNPDKPWSWGGISYNNFEKHKYYKYLSAKKIQQCWRRYIIGKKVRAALDVQRWWISYYWSAKGPAVRKVLDEMCSKEDRKESDYEFGGIIVDVLN